MFGSCNIAASAQYGLKTYHHNGSFELRQASAIAIYVKNFKLAQQLFNAGNTIQFNSPYSHKTYMTREGISTSLDEWENYGLLDIITHSELSAYDLEFILKNKIAIPNTYESLETVKTARKNIQNRKDIQYLATALRRKQQYLPVEIQKMITDFLQPRIYDNCTREKIEYERFSRRQQEEIEQKKQATIEREKEQRKKDVCCTIS